MMQDDYSEVKAALTSLRCNAFNIQTLLHMGQEGELSSNILGGISQVIQNHFSRVEALEIDIPAENRKEHEAILVHFEVIRTDWCDGTLSDIDYAELLSSRLFNHFSLFFQPLLDTYLDFDTQFEFKI
jgi:hypothetical protein